MNRLFREQKILQSKGLYKESRFHQEDERYYTFSYQALLPNGHVYPMYADLYGFPEKFPRVFVRMMLRDHDGNELSGCDGHMHVLSSENGCTQLCYAHSSAWKPSLGLEFIVKRSIMWLIAYEASVQTGNPIDYYLFH